MGKTRDLLKKIRDTKGTFRAKMGPIKDRKQKSIYIYVYIHAYIHIYIYIIAIHYMYI